MTARTALELVLEQVSDELGYTVRDGIIYVTQKYDNDEIQVYNVRDLLKGFRIPQAAPRMPGGEGMPGAGMTMGADGAGWMGGSGRAASATVGEALVRVIESTVFPETWSSAGGSGSLAEFNGLLVVKQSQTLPTRVTC